METCTFVVDDKIFVVGDKVVGMDGEKVVVD